MSQKQREELIRRPELSAKWQRFAYTTFLTNTLQYGDKGHMLNPQSRIRIAGLARMVSEIFKIPDNLILHNQLRKIREIAWNDRRRARSERVPLEEMARRRCIKLDDPDDP
jgi:hypothetical protein